ncbi:reverse transcriptase domain-containing protein [Tanacetum coccineum]
MARTLLNESCSAVILNKLPKKLGDPGRFLIPCEFSGINTCNALADLGANINLMPYSVWKNLSLPNSNPTCMTLELADCSISEPIGIAEDVYVTVGKFQFPADFVVVDFEPDPLVPLILERSFLKTSRALIDVYEGEITLRVGGNPTPITYDPIVSTVSPTFTPFGDSDFLLFEEADSFLAIEDDPTPPLIGWNVTSSNRKTSVSKTSNTSYGCPFLFKICADQMNQRGLDLFGMHGKKLSNILKLCHNGPIRGHPAVHLNCQKVFDAGFFWPSIYKMPKSWLKIVTRATTRKSFQRYEMPQKSSKFVKSLRFGA